MGLQIRGIEMSDRKANKVLEDMLRVVQGKKPIHRDIWGEHLSPHHNEHRQGRFGSFNFPRMSQSCNAFGDPMESMKWWDYLVTNEAIGHDVTDEHGVTRRFYEGTTAEPLSTTYEAWSWLGHAVAYDRLRGQFERPGSAGRMRRSLRRRAVMMALSAIEMDFYSKRGKIVWSGIASLPCGARSKPAGYRNYFPILSAALGVKPDRHRVTRYDRRIVEIVDALPDSTWGLSEQNRQDLLRMIRSPSPSLELFRPALDILEGTRTIVPITWYIYDDFIVVHMHHNPNPNTGAVFATVFPRSEGDSSELGQLHPYGGARRVRGKYLIGRGLCKRIKHEADHESGYRFVAENMTLAELNEKRESKGIRRNPERYVEGFSVYEEPVFTIECGPNFDIRFGLK